MVLRAFLDFRPDIMAIANRALASKKSISAEAFLSMHDCADGQILQMNVWAEDYSKMVLSNPPQPPPQPPPQAEPQPAPVLVQPAPEPSEPVPGDAEEVKLPVPVWASGPTHVISKRSLEKT